MTTSTTPAPKHDRTQTRRQARRRQRLDQISQAHGFDTWGKLETAVINGATITVTEANMKTIKGIFYFRCGTGDLGLALAAYLVAQYAGHRIEEDGTHYYHNAAWSPEMYEAHAAEVVVSVAYH